MTFLMEETVGAPTKAQKIFVNIAPFPALAFFKIWASPKPCLAPEWE
jgi:hypothetical protein